MRPGRRWLCSVGYPGFALCCCLDKETLWCLGEPWVGGTVSHSHGNPLLQRVPEVFLADGVGQGPQGWLELHHGLREVPEPAAQLHLVLQDPAFPWEHTGWGSQPSTGGLPACKPSWPGAHLLGAGPWCSPGWRRASRRAGLGLVASLLASCRRGHKPGTEWWLAAPSASTPELLFLHLQKKKKKKSLLSDQPCVSRPVGLVKPSRDGLEGTGLSPCFLDRN